MVLGKKARIGVVAVALVAVLIVAGAAVVLSSPNHGSNNSGKLQVVASFYPLYYFSSQIGGDRASVEQIIPDGIDPHAFEPAPSDVMKVDQAELLVYNGFNFEPWMGSFLEMVDNENLVTIDSSLNVPSLLSDTAVQQYTLGREALQAGVNATVNASSTIDGASAFDFNTAVLDVRLPEMGDAYGGYIVINYGEEGDHAIMSTNGTVFQLQDQSGNAQETELDIGYLSQYPEFNSSQRYDLDTGTYVLKIGPTSVNETTVVLLAIPEEVTEPGAPEHHHGLYDPHIWIDPVNAKVQVQNILDGFKQADPANADYYQKNADDLTARLEALNQEYIAGLANRTKNVIITTHEGFNYLAQQYGFQAYGATGVWADAQPSAQAIADLDRAVESYGLHYVFSEPVYSDAVIQTIASETGTQVLVLDGIHGRTGVHAGWDYFQIMEANLEALETGLEVTS
jgi:ABC-type Zn uptake system ZnuABC Zn-binding protein ZnuA